MSSAGLKGAAYALGIDVGGQSIKAQLLKIEESGLADPPAWGLIESTEKGTADHCKQIRHFLEKSAEFLHGVNGELISVGVGSPGRFDANGNIKPGTASNLGNDFDGQNLKTLYAPLLKALGLSEEVLTVANDGNAMLAGMLAAVASDSPKRRKLLHDELGYTQSPGVLRNKHVAMFGIGTGLGHAIAHVESNGDYQFVTDGHASKLQIHVDEEDWARFKAAAKELDRLNAHYAAQESEVERNKIVDPAQIVKADENAKEFIVRAEDLCRDPILKAMAGVDDARDIDMSNAEHKAAVDFAGKYMGRLIGQIASGESRDVDPTPGNGWSEDDKKEAAKTAVYLIGGGVGSSKIVGEGIIRAARAELKSMVGKLRQEGNEAQAKKLESIQLMRYPGENVAPHAAATMAYNKCSDKGIAR